MRSMRRALPNMAQPKTIGRWLSLTACSLALTASFFSCTISADAGRPTEPAVRIAAVQATPW